MKRTTLMFVTMLAVVPAAASAQSTGATSAASATAQAATPQARIDAAMQAAASAQIPTALLESKVREGAAKRVPQERVAAAVEARLNALIRARDALRSADISSYTDGELLVASEALSAGVSESALVSVTRSVPSERRAVATAVLTDLVRLGYDSGEASARLDAALSSGPEALVNLRAEAAASLRARGLLSTDIGAGIIGNL